MNRDILRSMNGVTPINQIKELWIIGVLSQNHAVDRVPGKGERAGAGRASSLSPKSGRKH
jgi:hypothetical protein